MIDRRFAFVMAAAFVIASLCVWRTMSNRSQDYADQVAAAVIQRPAPGFDALDSGNHLVRLGAFLGRHSIIVIFFDGEAGADQDADLLRLRERFGELQAQSVKVIAVSSAIPQKNRAAIERAGAFPFPLVSDFDPLSPEGQLRIHRHWGRIDLETGKPRTGVFVVDRKGQIAFTVEGPRPSASVDAAVEAALSGK